MTITTMDGALAGMQPPVFFQKAASPVLVAGRPHSFWYTAGAPGAGTSDKATQTGVVLNAPVNGQIPFTNPGAGNTNLSMLRGVSASQPGTLLLLDRLLVCGNLASAPSTPISVTSLLAQDINTQALPNRDNAGGATGLGVFAAVEVETATASGTPTLTLTYTNTNNIGSRTASNIVPTVASSAIGSFYPIGLASGDLGVKSVEKIQLTATWTSGNIVVVLYRVLAIMECPLALTPGSPLTLASGGFPRIYNDSVPFLVFIPQTTTAMAVRGLAGWTQG